MSKQSILAAAGICSLVSVGCLGREPLWEPAPPPGTTDGGGTVVDSGGQTGSGGHAWAGTGGGSGGGGVATVTGSGGRGAAPPAGGAPGASPLAGIWSGNVKISHPDFAGPPIDRMTIEIGDDGRLRYAGFEEFGYEASFGTPPDEIPLSGSAIAHVVKAAGFFLRFTVQAADWQSDHVQLTYTAFSKGLNEGETPETPYTDLTIAFTGTLVGDKVHVHWTEKGSQYTAALDAVADGDLAR